MSSVLTGPPSPATADTAAAGTTAEPAALSLARAERAGYVRAAIENITPRVEGGRFPVKRVEGESVVVEADCFADGHDLLACVLQFRHDTDPGWTEVPMQALGNDRWRASFTVNRLGTWRYAVLAWVDALASWSAEFARRAEDADLPVAAKIGAQLIEELVETAAAEARDPAFRNSDARARLLAWASALRNGPTGRLKDIAGDSAMLALARSQAGRPGAVRSSLDLRVTVERARARFSTWYELFPRSMSEDPGRHGTFNDVIARLPYAADMGFDVLYLAPIHPIGARRRKGRNNAAAATEGDVGSPWAVGSAEGGHTAIHPALGTLHDFRRLVAAARAHGLEIALDMAFQAAPDHPYVTAHPEWFRWRPDGSVQYAENPPKKYQDIYPLHFDGEAWRSLWSELLAVFRFWVGQGVRIFRVDNPHTKPFMFWEWLIMELRRDHPDVLFLAEAFTRPRIMHRLAKLGFSQSYTYFTWRTGKRELTEYFTELAQSPAREYFRPNCWPNTPDILAGPLRGGGRPAFTLRLVLAATLAANYGIYGPAFELMENAPRDHASEEYLDSEKYELRRWDLDHPDSLAPFIARINRIRRGSPALQSDWSLLFHATDNDQLLCYSKRAVTESSGNAVLVVANLDVQYAQSGWVTLDLAALGLPADEPYEVHDLLSDARYTWQGARNYVRLDPASAPAHIFALPAVPAD